MIAKILKSSKSFAAIRYNEEKVKEGVAELLEKKNIPEHIKYVLNSVEDVRKFFVEYSAKSDRVKKPQFHVAISCEGKSWTKEQLLDFAHQWLDKMGYGDNPALIYYHHDTDNNHLHIVTSRVGKDGKKISDHFEKVRSQNTIQQILDKNPRRDATEFLQSALSFRYESLGQFKAICEVNGYECYDKDDSLYLKKGGVVQAFISTQAIAKGQGRKNEEYYKRRNQLRAIMNKYLLSTASLEEFTDLMRKQHGLMFKFIGDKDKPRAYFVVDNATKTVFNGSDLVKMADLLDFEPIEERLKSVNMYIYMKLDENHDLTTAEINRMLKRYSGAFISKGKVMYQGRVVQELDAIYKDILKVNDRNKWLGQFSAATKEEKEHLAAFFHVDVKVFENSKDAVLGPVDLRNTLASLCEFSIDRKDFFKKMKEAGLSLKITGKTLFAIDFNSKVCMNVDAFAPETAKIIRSYVDTKRKSSNSLLGSFGKKRGAVRVAKVVAVRDVANIVAQAVSSMGTGLATTAVNLASAVVGRINSRGTGGVGGSGNPRKKKRLYDNDDGEVRMGR